MIGLLVSVAAAEPWVDPVRTTVADCIRADSRDVFLGDGAWAPWEVADKLGVDDGLAPERARDGWAPVVALRPDVRLSGGDAVPDDLGGDAEPGLVSGHLAAAGALYAGPFVVAVTPELSGGFVPGGVLDARVGLWAGARGHGFSVGFGKRDRWLGPGRHGALLLSDNAEPPWLGTLGVEGHLPGWFDRLGRFRIETGAGWLDRPRDDVANPGLLLTDLRWLPVPWIELGATRMAIFGGEGRPAPDLGQLLLPTEPHVYDDPDKLLPDQDELASLDVRVTLPLRKWTGLPVDYVEAWWQYGGEDVVARKIGPVPYPSLAGVGNLYGAAVKVAPIVATVEYTRLLDDYFRWYVGHRVYHDGFTQDGRVLGHFGGPDSETAFASVAYEGAAGTPSTRGHGIRARAWADWTRRVGVVEAQNDKLFTLMVEEHALRLGVDGGWRLPAGGWITLGYTWEHVTGADFVPGAEADRHRVYVGVEPARVFGGKVKLGGTPAGG